MAAPLKLESKPPYPAEEIRLRLERAPVEHADAVLAFYELLQLAHDRGIIDIMRGAIGRGDTVVIKLAEFASNPESLTLMRNLISLARIASSFDPEVLSALAKELGKQRERSGPADSAGLFPALRRLASKDTLRVVAASAAFVGAFGRALAASRKAR